MNSPESPPTSPGRWCCSRRRNDVYIVRRSEFTVHAACQRGSDEVGDILALECRGHGLDDRAQLRYNGHGEDKREEAIRSAISGPYNCRTNRSTTAALPKCPTWRVAPCLTCSRTNAVCGSAVVNRSGAGTGAMSS